MSLPEDCGLIDAQSLASLVFAAFEVRNFRGVGSLLVP
jgi:hypothetical protein